MKFFSDKNIISTIFAITLFNGVVAQGDYNPMANYRKEVPGTVSNTNGNNNQLHSILISNDSEPENTPLNDYPDNIGIIQGIPGQENIQDGTLINDKGRAPQFAIADINATSTSTPVSSTTTPTNRANTPKATTTSSKQLTTTTSTTSNTSSAPTPTPAPASAANSDTAPAPKSGNQIIDTVFEVIKSIFGFFWSHRVGIWNFLYTNILAPIWDWIKNKWFS